jgi:hypothetical protein
MFDGPSLASMQSGRVCLGLCDGCVQSIFERAAAGRSDPDAASPDRLVLGLASRALCCCKPRVHELSQRPACEAVVGEHDCLGGAEWYVGQQSKCSPLFDTDMTS